MKNASRLPSAGRGAERKKRRLGPVAAPLFSGCLRAPRAAQVPATHGDGSSFGSPGRDRRLNELPLSPGGRPACVCLLSGAGYRSSSAPRLGGARPRRFKAEPCDSLAGARPP
ncbi:hypothetical protein RRG08_049563 [Elysia crispata]|uniref:Uncharacterized protein n=1 Tax=Elysia crispata TaxID=231223 RepID=A0AAE0Z4N4_9GAST|nr:hypothetical protein RRG08_049549 [Elysia crispata]KAK3762699.1 hypothetical protein RRG08_049563 [Elysia crispata]